MLKYILTLFCFFIFQFNSILNAEITLNITTLVDTINESSGHYQLQDGSVVGVSNLGVYSLHIESNNSPGVEIRVNSNFSGSMRLNSSLNEGSNLDYSIVAVLNSVLTSSLTGTLYLENNINLAQQNALLIKIVSPSEPIDATFFINLNISSDELNSAFRSDSSIFSDQLEFIGIELD